jgi:chromosome segregation ATPase
MEKDTLESDNQRAIDRLNIMINRINIKYTSKENALQSQIDTIIEKLTSFKQQMDDINTEIVSLDIQMKSQCSLILQINELNQKIEKIQSQISQVKSDICTLSSN